MDRKIIEDKIKQLIFEVCEDKIVLVEPDINLDDEGLIDSIGYTELLILIEDALDIFIAPSEYMREEFNTPNKIVEAVLKKREK